MTPIETMLSAVEWTEIAPALRIDLGSDELPFATHSGVLEIAGVKLRCHRLNTGQTIFDADDVNAFFGGVSDAEVDA